MISLREPPRLGEQSALRDVGDRKTIPLNISFLCFSGRGGNEQKFLGEGQSFKGKLIGNFLLKFHYANILQIFCNLKHCLPILLTYLGMHVFSIFY
jgi:hypothetical protein